MIATRTRNSKYACDRPAIRRIAASGCASFNQQPRFYESQVGSRSAFTLVELLVTIAIISILATALLGAASLAGGTAREARTKARILRIHPLLMEHWDTYKNRRVELRDFTPAVQTALNQAVPPVPTSPGIDPNTRIKPRHRLAAIRELMKMEIPDRWSDVWLAALPSLPAIVSNTAPLPRFNAERSGLSNVYLRKLRQVARNAGTLEKLLENQGAECLYLVIMNATADGEARSLFSENKIGDTDGDGAPEFIDGWGRPIEFLRWAPGYSSDLQLSFTRIREIDQIYLANPNAGNQSIREALASDPDPFDIYRVGQTNFEASLPAPRGFRLVPLIFSGGPDEEYGLTGGPDDDISSWDDYVNALSDPYYDGVIPIFIGEAINNESHIDNITNHLIVGN